MDSGDRVGNGSVWTLCSGDGVGDGSVWTLCSGDRVVMGVCGHFVVVMGWVM